MLRRGDMATEIRPLLGSPSGRPYFRSLPAPAIAVVAKDVFGNSFWYPLGPRWPGSIWLWGCRVLPFLLFYFFGFCLCFVSFSYQRKKGSCDLDMAKTEMRYIKVENTKPWLLVNNERKSWSPDSTIYLAMYLKCQNIDDNHQNI